MKLIKQNKRIWEIEGLNVVIDGWGRDHWNLEIAGETIDSFNTRSDAVEWIRNNIETAIKNGLTTK